MARFNPFPHVSCKYGAPMGRISDAPGNFVYDVALKLYARRQGTGGLGNSPGYDQGGAYWGTPANVWAVWTRGGEAVCYVRASSKSAAIRSARGE